MARGASLSRTSGDPNCVLIVLCEGMHDYEFIREVISRIEPNRKVMNVEPKDKDRLVRHVIDNKELPYIPVIIEGCRDRLDRNVRVLVSKLRSIRSFTKVKVLVLRDSDSNDVVNTFDRLKCDVENFISNRDKFPQYKPSVECGQGINAGSFMSHDCTLRYRDGEVLFRFVLVIPSLEGFLRSYGFAGDESSLHDSIMRALDDPRNNGIMNIFKSALCSC